jgi:hypothetical protein
MSKFGSRSSNASSGSRFGGSNSRAQSSGEGQQNENFANIGTISVTRKTTEKLGDGVKDDLRNSGITLSASIYLPKGQEAVTLRNKDTVLIVLKEVKGKGGKTLTDRKGNPMDYIVGRLVLPLDE